MTYELRNVHVDDAALDFVVNSPAGPVGRHLDYVGRRVLTLARPLAGSRTGRLRASLYMRHERSARGQLVEIGSPLDYAYYNHEGTRPYTVRARAGRVLMFVSRGRRIYTRSITHPRTRGTHFLTIPLRRVLGS